VPADFCQVGGPTSQLQHHSGLEGRGKSATNYYPLTLFLGIIASPFYRLGIRSQNYPGSL
jgi:hypothetical protein